MKMLCLDDKEGIKECDPECSMNPWEDCKNGKRNFPDKEITSVHKAKYSKTPERCYKECEERKARINKAIDSGVSPLVFKNPILI